MTHLIYEHFIDKSKSVKHALKLLNELPDSLTLFVIDESKKLIGTLTDGDIRRGIINGKSLEDKVHKFMNKKYSFVEKNKIDFTKLQEFRKNKIKVVPLIDNYGKVVKICDFSHMKSILPVDAVIMAGGKGTRLSPLTKKTPKPLLKIGNKEIISYNFERLYQYGIINQFVTVNYLAEKVEGFCKTFYNDKINFSIIKETEFLGTAGSLSLIDNFEQEYILLMNSDILTNINFEDLFKTFLDANADMIVSSVPYQVSLPYAILDLDDEIIKSFVEKPNYTYYANAGIYLFKKEIIELIPRKTFFNATDIINNLKKDGGKIIHYPITSYWLDIGRHSDFKKAQRDINHINF